MAAAVIASPRSGLESCIIWIDQSVGGRLVDPARCEAMDRGEGQVTVNSRVDADGVEHGRASVTARITTADGRSVHLNVHGATVGFPNFINYGG